MKLDKHVVDMFTELTKPADDVKMEKTCYGTISIVDGTRYVKLDGSDLLVPAASTVKTSHGDRVTVLMKNHSLTITGNLTAPATDGEGGSSGEAGTAATIEVGTVTTGEAGSSAAVTNSGTASAAVFDFVIPRGDKGEKGDTGPQGPQGEKGDTGTWDGTIPGHEHTVSDITDLPNFALAENKFLDDFFSSKSGDIRALVIDLPSGGFGGNTDRLPNITGFPITGDILITWSKSVYSNGFRYGTLQVRSMTQSNLPVYQCSVYNDGVYTDWQKLCDGGNSDTVDGLHAADLFQKSEGLRSGNLYYDIFSDSLTSDHPCWNKHCCTVGQSTNPDSSDYIDNAPENSSALWYEVFTCGIGNRAYQIAFGCFGHQHKTFIRYKHDEVWSEWYNITDGGNADTVDGLHATGFAQMEPNPETSTLITSINDCLTPGSYVCNSIKTPDYPTNIVGTWGVLHVYAYGLIRYHLLMTEGGAIAFRSIVTGQQNWTDWKRLDQCGGFAGQLANLFSDSTAENPIFSTVPDDATLNSLSSGIYAVNTSAARTSLGIPPIVSSGYPSGVSADNYIKPGGILIKLGTVLPGPGYQYQRGFCDSNVPVCCAFFIENNGGMYMAYGYLYESSMRWNWRGFCMDYYSEPSPIAIRAIVYLKKDVVVTSNTPYEIYSLNGQVIIPYTAGIAYGPTRQYSLKRGTSSVTGRPCFFITTAGTLPAGRYLLSMH